MRSFISEDDIEQALCARLAQPEYGWKRIECAPSVDKQVFDDKTSLLLNHFIDMAVQGYGTMIDESLLRQPISIIGLPIYVEQALGAAGIKTIFNLVNHKRIEIKAIPRLGFKALDKIDLWLEGHYLDYDMKISLNDK